MKKQKQYLTCDLMHKAIPVAKIKIDSADGKIEKVVKVLEPAHLPVGVSFINGIVNREALNRWWGNRCIPASRSGIEDIVYRLDIYNLRQLAVRSFGLSLSDQYWICPEQSGVEWQDVNFFTNDFSSDIGDVLFRIAEKNSEDLDFSSPDSTSNGDLKKRWKIVDGKRCLVKGGSYPTQYEPFNEVIASEIMKHLEIPSVRYYLISEGANKENYYSVCEDFIDETCDLIPAWSIFNHSKQRSSQSIYQHFVSSATALGIPSPVEFLDRMIVVDYLIMNEDRHFNNFGAIRNAETLEWLGMSPIYDSGSCLGFHTSTPFLRSHEFICKPFKNTHSEQLKLVSSFQWLDADRLDKIPNIIGDVLGPSPNCEAVRIDILISLVKNRIDTIKQKISSEKAVFFSECK